MGTSVFSLHLCAFGKRRGLTRERGASQISVREALSPGSPIIHARICSDGHLGCSASSQISSWLAETWRGEVSGKFFLGAIPAGSLAVLWHYCLFHGSFLFFLPKEVQIVSFFWPGQWLVNIVPVHRGGEWSLAIDAQVVPLGGLN